MSRGRSDSDSTIQSYVIFDLETTGLPPQKPKITELCFLGVSRRDLLNERPVPRVINKLLIFTDPGKDIEPEAAAITGLDNDLLSDQKTFDSDLVQLMSIFLSRLPKPVCLVAHNGDRFDYPLLMSELKQANNILPDDLTCVDTLQAFRELEKQPSADDKSEMSKASGDSHKLEADEKTTQGDRPSRPVKTAATKVSFKLETVYKRSFGEAPPVCHTAEDDCLTLLKFVTKFSPAFVEWADKKAKLFKDTGPMY